MATSNADRQRAYRERHLNSTEGTADRLAMLVDVDAKRKLERLARHHGITQRAMLERIIADTERALVDGMQAGEQKAYYAVTA